MSFIVERVKRRTPLAKADKPVVAGSPMSRDEITKAVCAIKETARRLRPPLNMNPNAWHEDKSDLVRMVERLEDAVRYGRKLKDAAADSGLARA